MATYRELHGKAVKTVTTNPSDDAAEGQIWFNSTDNTFKSAVFTESWVSSGPLIQEYKQGGFAGNSQSAAIHFGGYPVPASASKTFEYNGIGFSTGGDLGTAKYLNGGAGTQTAALDYGGYKGTPPITIPAGNVTQEYDGSSWSNASAALGTARYNVIGSGTQTAALSAGGTAAPPGNASTANNTVSEEYNGSSWSEGNNLNTTRRLSGSQSGPQTAAIMFGGDQYGASPTKLSSVENYDGTSWTTGTSLPGGLSRHGTSGTQTSALIFGGNSGPGPVTASSLSWDGTSFAADASLATARSGGARAQDAPSTGAVFMGGASPPTVTVTEEYNRSTNVVTAAAWASGGSLNTSRTSMFTGPIGTQTAGYAAGGSIPSGRSNATEEYDGSSWTTVNTVPVSLSSRGGAGTQTAAVLFSGNPNPSTVTTTTEYDGTNYSEGGAMNNSRGYGPIASGTQTAALGGGGYNPSASPGNITVTEYYNGTAWTSQPAANPATYGGASGGTQTATWMLAGIQQPPSPTKAVVEWDGSSWTAGASYGTDHVVNLFGGGPQTAAWMCGGQIYPGSGLRAFTNHYDGTVWATAPSLGTARSGACQGGTQAAGLVAGGISSLPSTRTDVTEEFTGETTSLNIETLTQS